MNSGIDVLYCFVYMIYRNSVLSRDQPFTILLSDIDGLGAGVFSVFSLNVMASTANSSSDPKSSTNWNNKQELEKFRILEKRYSEQNQQLNETLKAC